MSEPPEISHGHLLPAEPGGAKQNFKLYQRALDQVELRFDESGIAVKIQVERLAGYEVRTAIEKHFRLQAWIDVSKLSF